MKIVTKNSMMKKREVEAENVNEERPCKRMKTDIKKEGLRMISSAFYIPKDEPLKPQGEDAHFVAEEEQTIGVADGVGGWAKHGIDSGKYARELMKNSMTAVLGEAKDDGSVQVDPKRVLHEAFSKTKLPGASTACILTHKNGVLRAVNVGDSGFMVFRDRQLLYTSPTQQHHFNCPYQLGNAKKSDRPDCAMEMEVEVMEGDLIVMGTDGLLDNMFSSEIEEIIEKFETEKEEKVLQDLAWKIAGAACRNSLSTSYVSPFEIANTILMGRNYEGGKVDDIMVIVGKIVRHSDLKMCT